MSRVPYQSVVGSLMYVIVSSIPKISQAVGVISKHMSNPSRVHWDVVKRVFKYFHSYYSLCYHSNVTKYEIYLDIYGYFYLNWVGGVDSRRSTSAYAFTLFGSMISWMSKRCAMVALSTTKVEFMAATHACKEAIWIKRLCSYIRIKQDAMKIYCDNQSVICLAKNLTFYARTKHIDVQYHFFREMVEDGKVKFFKLETLIIFFYSLTKLVSIKKFILCSKTMGLLAPNN
jgi:hypothetical protein